MIEENDQPVDTNAIKLAVFGAVQRQAEALVEAARQAMERGGALSQNKIGPVQVDFEKVAQVVGDWLAVKGETRKPSQHRRENLARVIQNDALTIDDIRIVPAMANLRKSLHSIAAQAVLAAQRGSAEMEQNPSQARGRGI